MAQLVAAIGVPHTPIYASQYAKDGHEEPPRNYREVKAHLDAVQADAIIVIANDHFNTFFLNNFPTFALGVAGRSSGPNDQTKMPHYDFAIDTKLARHLWKQGIAAGFDFSVTQEFTVDHSILVPLHFLTDGVTTPIVPIWVNAFVRPWPSARRCYALGSMLKEAITGLPGTSRVVVMATGSFSLEIAGPKVDAGTRASTPDIEWSKHVHGRIKNGEVDVLLTEATPERMWKAGNAGAELLNWMVMLAAIGRDRPEHIADHNDVDGHTYAVWR